MADIIPLCRSKHFQQMPVIDTTMQDVEALEYSVERLHHLMNMLQDTYGTLLIYKQQVDAKVI